MLLELFGGMGEPTACNLFAAASPDRALGGVSDAELCTDKSHSSLLVHQTALTARATDLLL